MTIQSNPMDQISIAYEQAQCFSNIFDNMQIPQLLMDPKTFIIQRANQASLEFYGYANDQLIGLNFESISETISYNDLPQSCFDGSAGRCHCIQTLENGKVKNVRIHTMPMTLEDKDYLYVILEDETKKNEYMKRYVHELQKNEVMINAMDDGIFVMETDDNLVPQTFIEVGPAVAHRLGMKPEGLIGQPVEKVLPLVENSEIRDALETLKNDGHVHLQIREQIRGLDKGPIEVTAQALRYNHKNYILAITRELTEPYRFKRERDNQNKMFSSLFQNVHSAMFLVDEQARIVDLNASAEDMFQLVKATVVGTSLRFWIGNGKPLEECDEIIEYLKQGKVYTKPVRRISQTGREVDVILTAYETVLPNNKWGMLLSYATSSKDAPTDIFDMIYTDSLTGLDNRDAFLNRISKLISESGEGKGFYLVNLDIKDFKEINDNQGHLFGDALLQKLSSQLRKHLGEDAMIARMGGDTFSFLLFGEDDEVSRTTEDLLAKLTRPFQLQKKRMLLDVRMGIAMYPEHGMDEETLVSNAELALNEAKKPTGQKVRMFTHVLRNAMMGDYQLREALRNAVGRNELEMYYQPIVRMVDRSIAGFEALMRWKSPEFGMVSPGRFIPLAEKSGIIHTLGNFALEQGTKDLAVLRDKGEAAYFLSVNVSPLQLQHFDFVRNICNVVVLNGAEKGIDIELTESAYMQDYFQLNRIMRALKAMGIAVSIDDFGTGYSSLGQLTTMDIDKVKIDQSFVKGIGKNERSVAVIRAVMGMFNELDIPLVAEGIETADQFEWLKSRGCQYGQGYLFGRPQPLAYWVQMLQAT